MGYGVAGNGDVCSPIHDNVGGPDACTFNAGDVGDRVVRDRGIIRSSSNENAATVGSVAGQASYGIVSHATQLDAVGTMPHFHHIISGRVGSGRLDIERYGSRI